MDFEVLVVVLISLGGAGILRQAYQYLHLSKFNFVLAFLCFVFNIIQHMFGAFRKIKCKFLKMYFKC